MASLFTTTLPHLAALCFVPALYVCVCACVRADVCLSVYGRV